MAMVAGGGRSGESSASSGGARQGPADLPDLRGLQLRSFKDEYDPLTRLYIPALLLLQDRWCKASHWRHSSYLQSNMREFFFFDFTSDLNIVIEVICHPGSHWTPCRQRGQVSRLRFFL
jgi:hypothetical protein